RGAVSAWPITPNRLGLALFFMLDKAKAKLHSAKTITTATVHPTHFWTFLFAAPALSAPALVLILMRCKKRCVFRRSIGRPPKCLQNACVAYYLFDAEAWRKVPHSSSENQPDK